MLSKFRSLRAQTVLRHILVTLATVVISLLSFWIITSSLIAGNSVQGYQPLVAFDLFKWMNGLPDGSVIDTQYGNPDGFTLFVDADGDTILHTFGETSPCAAGDRLADCAPQYVDAEVSAGFVDGAAGEERVEIISDFVDGRRVILDREVITPELALFVEDTTIYGNLNFILVVTGFAGIIAVPVALILSTLLTRRQVRRLSNLTATSRAFAEGDFSARVNDHDPDEIGMLAGQFDAMADVLSQNIDTLRDLAQRNAELLAQVEQSGKETERVKLARDLHDALAQNLFSLSFNASALPGLIEQGSDEALKSAERIAQMAEDAQLDLRKLIVDLRPEEGPRKGLAESLQDLTTHWSQINNLPVECNVVLRGRDIPSGVQSTIYRVAQEALNNVAKHAGATSVSVSVVEGSEQITLSVTDDGRGFEAATSPVNGRLGLLGMRERARALGGTLAIESDTERGTTIRLSLPIFLETPELTD